MVQRLVHRLSTGIEIIAVQQLNEDGLSVVSLYRPDNCLQILLPPCKLGGSLDGTLVDQLVLMHADLLGRAGFLLPKSSPKSNGAASEKEVATLLRDLNAAFMSAPIDDAGQQTGMIESAKTLISLTRRVIRRNNDKSVSLALQSTISEAYRVMGKAYERLGRLNKAQTSYTLSLKTSGTYDPSTVSALGELSSLLATIPGEERVGDIENILGAHDEFKGLNERSGFACSMCGECVCRRPNHVLLTPLDLFIICRSPVMSVAGVRSTTSLFKHAKFGKAFILEQQGGPGGYPCLRLGDSEKSSSTDCHFSYPLFSHGGLLMNIDDYQLWRREEDEIEESSRRHSGPLQAHEFNLTEEEEHIFAGRVDVETDGDQDDDNDNDNENDNDEGLSREFPQSVMPILNSHGRQALGCILGPAHMPSTCLSYPFSYELSVVDEWHSRSKEAHQSGWEEEEMFVMRRSHGCEGFVDDTVAPGPGPITPLLAAGENKSFDVTGGSSRNKAGERTVRELLLSAGDDAIDRVKESAWFRGLVAQLAQFLPAQSFPDEGGVRLAFIQILFKIWFDFDGWNNAISRPIKTWGRLKSEIDSRSWALIQSTKAFLQSDGRTNADKYNELIKRQGIC